MFDGICYIGLMRIPRSSM